MKTFEEKKQELLNRADTMLSEGKITQDQYDQGIMLMERGDNWFSSGDDYNKAYNGRLNYLKSARDNAPDCFKERYQQTIDHFVANPLPKVQVACIGLYIQRFLDSKEIDNG